MYCLTVNFFSNNFLMSFWLCYQYTNKPNMQLEVMEFLAKLYAYMEGCTHAQGPETQPHMVSMAPSAVLPGMCKRFLIATMKQYL